MNYLLATSDKQLGICLRMLYAERIQPIVQTVMNGKGKIEFRIRVAADEDKFAMLEERYRVLIS